ncbi:hypothetical protein C8R44DRAFT_805694 [Mycena epipterygia]|nr:hypothetical protein C8R44DRAFT_805694 [Mycena epipterygia]
MSSKEEKTNAIATGNVLEESNDHGKAILSAISASDIVLLSSLIGQAHADPKAYPTPPRQTMLTHAASENRPLALAYLLQSPSSQEDVTPPLLQCCAPNLECYKVLVAAHPHALAFGLGHTGDVFGLAVMRGDLDFMRYAANEASWNIDPNASELFHRPVIQMAAEFFQVHVLRCLLTECGVVRVGGTYAIKAAIRGGRLENLRCLLEHAPEGTKAVVDGWPSDFNPTMNGWQDKRWGVPNLQYAVALGKAEAVSILLSAGADPILANRRATLLAFVGRLIISLRWKRRKS